MRPSASSKSHKWAANIERIFGYTKLFLSLRLKFSSHLQSLDPFDPYYGKAGILKQFGQTKQPEPQSPLECRTYRQKHLGKGQYIEKDTDAQYNEPCAERESGKPRSGLPEKYSEP